MMRSHSQRRRGSTAAFRQKPASLLTTTMMLSSLLLLLWFARGVETQANPGEHDLGQLYYDVLSSYNVFPPLDTGETFNSEDVSIDPIQAVFSLVLVSVDVISPGQSYFSVSTRKVMYWNKESCNLTMAHGYICSRIIEGLHFLQPVRSVGDAKIINELHLDAIHEADFEALNLTSLTPAVDVVEDQVTYMQQFDVKTYPYEYHNLVIELAATASSNVVNLTSFAMIDPTALSPTVPQGWTLRGIDCFVQTAQEGRAISEFSDGAINFPSYICNVLVSKVNTGGWMTSYLLFFGLNLIAYMGGLGVASHFAAEGRDDKDQARQGLFNGMRLNGVFSIGLMLTYVFQVQIAPYGQPVEFWPNIPASSIIYILGLFGLLLMSFLALLSSLLLKKVLVADGFTGNVRRPYDLKHLPIEGQAAEEELPLLNTKRLYEEEPMEKRGAAKAENQPESDDTTLNDHDAGSEDHIIKNDAESNAGTKKEEGRAAQTDKNIPVETKCKSKTLAEDHIESTPNPAEEQRTPTSRKSNQKIYSVLSVQEAALVNKLVRMDFLLRTVSRPARESHPHPLVGLSLTPNLPKLLYTASHVRHFSSVGHHTFQGTPGLRGCH